MGVRYKLIIDKQHEVITIRKDRQLVCLTCLDERTGGGSMLSDR